MTLPAYLDAVEQGRIPADEIAHETRLARTAFKEALAEAIRAEREAWEPIETAPHGEAVLLFCPDRGATNEQRIELGYASSGSRNHVSSSISRHAWATHWRPLPLPPGSRPSPDLAVVPSLDELIEAARARGPMTEAERTAQRESFVRGNVAMSRDDARESPPPDLAAMRRVVDQARRVRRAFRNGLPDLSALMLELVVAVECLDEPLTPGGEP